MYNLIALLSLIADSVPIFFVLFLNENLSLIEWFDWFYYQFRVVSANIAGFFVVSIQFDQFCLLLLIRNIDYSA